MTSPTPDQLAAYIVALLFAFAAGYERFINRKKAEKIEVNQTVLSEALAFKERGDLMLKQAEEYRGLLEQEYKAHQATREFHHTQSQLAQEKLSACNEKCLELQSRTDITRVEQNLTLLTVAMTRVGTGVEELLKRNHP